MIVKMLVSMSGGDFTRAVGETCEVDEAEGARLIAAEFAVAVAPGVVAPAQEQPAENAEAAPALENMDARPGSVPK